MRKFKIIAVFIVGTLLFSQAANASLVTLSSLIASNGSISSGDKLFSEFGYGVFRLMPPADAITIEDITLNGNFGIRIRGEFGQLPPNGGTSFAILTYRVTAASGQLIREAFVSGDPHVDHDGHMIVSQGLLPEYNDQISVYDRVEGISHSTILSDMVTLVPPTKLLHVSTGITGISNGGVPTLSTIDQTFAQTAAPTPEPSTLTLAAIGLVSIAGMTWRKRRRAV